MPQRQPLVGAAWLRLRHQVFAAEYESLVAAAQLPPGGDVLDAGCGVGTHLAALRRAAGPGASVSGCDLSPDNIDAARTARDEGGEGYTQLDVAGITGLPYEDRRFTAVWCANVLQYLDDAAAVEAMHELLRVLRPGGVLALKDSDMLLWRLHPADPLLLARLLQAQTAAGGTPPSIRGRVLRRMVEAAGGHQVQQHSVLLERWAPLSDAAQRMYAQWLRELATVAQAAALSDADHAAWSLLADPDQAGHPLRSPDFYACEGQVLVTAQAP
jgi:ubiquinone/menaquinone biosynthesis C-methylase UbiE